MGKKLEFYQQYSKNTKIEFIVGIPFKFYVKMVGVQL